MRLLVVSLLASLGGAQQSQVVSSSRFGLACHDAARQRLVVVNDRGPVWEWDGRRWGERQARTAGTVVSVLYDGARSRVFAVIDGRLHEYDGATLVDRGAAPSANLTADTSRGRLVALRWPNGFGPVETHEWDGSSWRIVATLPQSFGFEPRSTVAYDPSRRVCVTTLHGVNGWETLEWDGTSWRIAATDARRFAPSVWDPLRQMVLSLVGETWGFDGTAWVRLAALPDAFASATTDFVNGVVVAHAGSHLWVFDAAGWRRDVPLDHPDVRWPWFTFDTVRGVAVLFGLTSDVHEWNGTTWRHATPPLAPPSRILHAQAFDGARGETVIFGGQSVGGPLGDTWLWNGSSWRQAAGPGPSPRPGAMMAFDSTRNRVVLVGGHLADGHWEWDGVAWQEVSATVPIQRPTGAMGYDPVRRRLVVAADDETTWEHDGTIWALRATSSPHPLATSPTITSRRLDWHPQRQRLQALLRVPFVAGDQRCEWDGAAWTLLGSAEGGQLLFDPVRGTTLVYDVLRLRTETVMPAAAAAFGSACGSTGSTTLPSLGAFRRPVVGDRQFHLDVRADGGLRPAAIGFGWTQASTPLANGCTLRIGQTFHTVLWFTDPAGVVHQPLPLPSDLALRGLPLFAQAAVLDPRSPGGFTLSQGLRLDLGD